MINKLLEIFFIMEGLENWGNEEYGIVVGIIIFVMGLNFIASCCYKIYREKKIKRLNIPLIS